MSVVKKQKIMSWSSTCNTPFYYSLENNCRPCPLLNHNGPLLYGVTRGEGPNAPVVGLAQISGAIHNPHAVPPLAVEPTLVRSARALASVNRDAVTITPPTPISNHINAGYVGGTRMGIDTGF